MNLRIVFFSATVFAATILGIADFAKAQLIRQQIGNAANQIVNQGVHNFNAGGGGNFQQLGNSIGQAAQQYGQNTAINAQRIGSSFGSSASIAGSNVGKQVQQIGRYGQKLGNQIAAGQSVNNIVATGQTIVNKSGSLGQQVLGTGSGVLGTPLGQRGMAQQGPIVQGGLLQPRTGAGPVTPMPTRQRLLPGRRFP